MIYEFIATISAGFAMAGLALIIKHLSKLAGWQTPKWLIPVFVGIGMLGFQIHQEYHWYEQTATKLPSEVKVIKTVESTAWYKPWSYIQPQNSKFMAIDVNSIVTNSINPNLKKVDLYLFERRMSTQRKAQLINCVNAQRADLIEAVEETDSNDLSNQDTPMTELTWYPLAQNDPILKYTCQ